MRSTKLSFEQRCPAGAGDVVSAHRRRAGVFAALVVAFWILAPGLGVRAASIVDSKHNLAISGRGDVKAVLETEVCIFCHTPHQKIGVAPLWNRQLSVQNYTPYSSSTLKATDVGQPTGASKLCLSCHDGTVALGMVSSRNRPIQMRGGVSTMPAGTTRLGTDLSDDHPISFNYSTVLAGANTEVKQPSMLDGRVRLDADGQMQCTSCHDPHDDQFGKFLVKDNTASALCLTCHQPEGWEQSVHKTSVATWNGQGANPWRNAELTTVAANACGSCHVPHNAGSKQRLLVSADEEQNCYSCHGGSVAQKNVQADFNKISVHPVALTTGVHDPAEEIMNAPRHVTCVDCHNPHFANAATAVAPNSSGALAGVAGVNSSGTIIDPITKQYELCYRCHADGGGRGSALVSRDKPETNTRIEFAPNNLSFHPVQTVGKNPNVPSLILPNTPASVIYCTDCHNSDSGPGANGTGANGPHGSLFRPLLERNLVLTDFTPENEASYALCYKCHSRTSILGDQSFPHNLHVVQEETSCVTCHDSHGSPDSTHLINFNPEYAKPSTTGGKLEFVDTGTFSGNCTVLCHDYDHVASKYPMTGSALKRGIPARKPKALRTPRR